MTAPTAAPDPAPARPTPPGDVLDANRVRDLWTTSIVGSIPSRRTRALLHDAQVVGVEGTSLRLALPSAPLAKMVSDESNLGPVKAALQQALGGSWQIEVVVGGAGGTGPSAASTPPVAPPPPEGSGAAKSWSGDAAPAKPRRPAPPDLAAQEPPEQAPPPDPEDPRDNSEPLGEPDPRTGRRVGDPEELAETLLRAQLGARPVEQT